jgi:hypothetical protein
MCALWMHFSKKYSRPRLYVGFPPLPWSTPYPLTLKSYAIPLHGWSLGTNKIFEDARNGRTPRGIYSQSVFFILHYTCEMRFLTFRRTWFMWTKTMRHPHDVFCVPSSKCKRFGFRRWRSLRLQDPSCPNYML